MRSILISTDASDDYPYTQLPGDRLLWRYIDELKFNDLVLSRQFWFSRIDTFTDDPSEGSKPSDANHSPGEAKFFKDFTISGWGEHYPGASDEQKTHHFALCWHINQKENRKMWKRYTKDNPRSLALVGSVKSLQSAFTNWTRRITDSPVKYCLPEDPRPQFDYTSIFFYKDKEMFGWEKEYRFLCSLQPSDLPFRLDHREGQRIMVPFNCRTAIKRIVLHPKAPEDFRIEVESKCQKILPRLKKVESSIFNR